MTADFAVQRGDEYMKKLIAGNWKMNGSLQCAKDLMSGIADSLSQRSDIYDRCDFLVCPPYIHIPAVQNIINEKGVRVSVGAQNCSVFNNGAYTGDISAEMISDMNLEYVILGHSERREYYGEADETIAIKAQAAHGKSLITVICVGETSEQRESGQQNEIVGAQLDAALPDTANASNTVIAYEPVWAIGTGNTATTDDVLAMHKFIREKLQEKLEDFSQVRILYGGSVKPDNAESLFALDNVDGALIGGASLQVDQFLGIASAAPVVLKVAS